MDAHMRIYGRSSAELREMCMEWYLRPLSRKVFEKSPATQSVVFCVGQYWADNASDEVHHGLVMSTARNPQWPSPEFYATYRRISPSRALLDACHMELFGAPGVNLGSQHRLIVAFASFCKEGCTQDDEPIDIYLPYAIARRAEQPSGLNPSGVDIEIVGEMLRPEAENNWNVGYRGAELQELYDRLPDSDPPPADPSLPLDCVMAGLHMLEEIGDWQGYVRELLHAADESVRDPSRGSQERLRRALESVRHLGEYAGLLSPSAVGRRMEPED